jgi:Serine dehydrogenase proteinase
VGIYSEYLDLGPALDLVAERKKQLGRIAALRGRDILVFASDSSKARQGAQVSIDNSDLLPLTDQIANLNGTAIDVLLETGGGSGETTEDIVRMLRGKYESVAFIVPGMAKSAGTIMVMAGDEILMEPSSSLGPIDAQIQADGKVFSAEAFLVGLDQIKNEVTKTNSLNRAYIPILQRISPGEIQHAQNALSFAKELVTRWLREYKFKNWTTHRTHSPGTSVTPEQKEVRAQEIAQALCDHSRHLSHGRSIKIPDLEAIGLEITDYSKIDGLSDAIRRYHVLLQITFETAAVYKLFETTTSQIMRFMVPAPILLPGLDQQNLKPIPETGKAPGGTMQLPVPSSAVLGFQCGNCKRVSELQLDFQSGVPLKAGAQKVPKDDTFVCPQCKVVHNLTPLRRQVELQMKRKSVQ